MASLSNFPMFKTAQVPHAVIQKDSESFLPQTLQDVYSWTSQNYRLTNPYNLFLKYAVPFGLFS